MQHFIILVQQKPSGEGDYTTGGTIELKNIFHASLGPPLYLIGTA